VIPFRKESVAHAPAASRRITTAARQKQAADRKDTSDVAASA
jgi:hypothetical protein